MYRYELDLSIDAERIGDSFKARHQRLFISRQGVNRGEAPFLEPRQAVRMAEQLEV